MNRRGFGLLAGGSLIALRAARAKAQAIVANASQLGTTLTPLGAEMAGNADGSIPAWTGGMTSMPAGVQAVGHYTPDLFPAEQPIVIVNASNMEQYADRLPLSVMAMMKKYGYSIKVYPTHRTAAAPQSVYDNTKANLGRAKFVSQDPVGGRYGFEGAYGGIPFPIPDLTNPLTAGAQIIANHLSFWRGFCYGYKASSWVVSSGNTNDLVMAFSAKDQFRYPYYDPAGSIENYNNILQYQFTPFDGPQNLVGQELVTWEFTKFTPEPSEAWELLNGEGRVRRAPEVSFDTPSPSANGVCQYDEYLGFNGSMEKYDWKCLGKKEMYIPYNNNKLYGARAQDAHKAHFLDPDLVRWEKHRCWVVEATLHPGERNVLAKRVFYVDEDTWQMAAADEYDGNMNLYKANLNYNYCQPSLPGVVYGQNTINNLQVDDYASTNGVWDLLRYPNNGFDYSVIPAITFDPSQMAAASQY